MKAALYARYSTDLQREESIDDQFRQCERVANAQGFAVVARMADQGISGGTAERPGYQRLIAAARAGQVDIIVAEDISRLWRSRAEYGPRSAELEDAGVHLLTCVGDDTRRDGWGLVLGIKQAIAEHQRREVSYRTRRGLEGLAERGESTGGRVYGFRADAPYEPEAVVVRRIFELARSGLLPSQVAAMLNAEGLPGPRGPRWSLNAVKRVLGNPRYAGRLSWGSTVSQGGARDSRCTRHVPRPGGPLVQRTIPALVDPALWGACNPGAVVG
jgi:site-specific DNA recombinase